MDRPRVVLDANVLYPASLRDSLLRAADAGLFAPVWSAEILEEVGRNLISDARLRDDQVQRLLSMMQQRFPLAEVTGFEHLIAGLTNHPKDRHVLAAAIVADAHVIVTSNLRDFPARALRPFRIGAQSPDDFLLDLFGRASELMLRIIDEQASALRHPPVTVDGVVRALALQAPGFAAVLKRRLAES